MIRGFNYHTVGSNNKGSFICKNTISGKFKGATKS